MARKLKDADSPFTGTLNIKHFDEALDLIQENRQISKEEARDIVIQSIDKAVRDTLNPRKIEGMEDLHTETVIDDKNGEIVCYTCKDVLNEDDIQDDLVQISVEDAKEIDPSMEVGSVLKEKVDLREIDYQFFRKAIQNIQQRLSEASKLALLNQYKDRVGQIITGVVEKVDRGYTNLTIGNVSASLSPRDSIRGEVFSTGDTVKVYLAGVGAGEGKDKSTQLMISRSSDKFLEKLFENEIPDVADGTVKIKTIAREAGSRSKVAVYSDSENVDPTGACIGNDGKRIKDICNQIHNEKIDVVKYIPNIYLYIAESLKPATVVGVVLNEELLKAVAVVKNGESKVAIGKAGVNVRLASRLVGYSINIKELDDAMGEHISYLNIDDIKRKEALSLLDAAEENYVDDTDEDEEISPIVEDSVTEEVEEVNKPVEEVVVPQEEVKEEVKEEAKVEEVKVEEPKSINEVEHVEIKSKAKVSLADLEKQIEEEKKRQNSQPSFPSYKKKFNKDEKTEKDDKKKEKKVVQNPNAMPIYTQEELAEIEAEENNDNVSTEDYEDYDSDDYYEDK